MSKKILFVVEGKRDESKYLIPVFKKALKLADEDTVICKYKASIYALYDQMKNEGYESFLSYLYSFDKSLFSDSTETPENSFSSVYLIFDLDPQRNDFSLRRISEMCDMFADETRNGKIYFSVPMSQSIFDFSSYRQKSFNNRTYPIKKLASDYKRESKQSSFLALKYNTTSLKALKVEDMYSVTVLNMKKYCYLTKTVFSSEWNKPYNPKEIVNAEAPYICKGKISIICGGLLLIPDYSPVLVEQLKQKKK